MHASQALKITPIQVLIFFQVSPHAKKIPLPPLGRSYSKQKNQFATGRNSERSFYHTDLFRYQRLVSIEFLTICGIPKFPKPEQYRKSCGNVRIWRKRATVVERTIAITIRVLGWKWKNPLYVAQHEGSDEGTGTRPNYLVNREEQKSWGFSGKEPLAQSLTVSPGTFYEGTGTARFLLKSCWRKKRGHSGKKIAYKSRNSCGGADCLEIA